MAVPSPAHHNGDRCGGGKGVLLGEGQLQHEWCCCPCIIPKMKQTGHPAMHQTFVEAAKRRERDTASGACFSGVSAVAQTLGCPRPSDGGKQEQRGGQVKTH